MSEQSEQPHISVMLNEVIEALKPADGETYVDATFGAGGYTRAILDAAKCSVYAIDRDPQVVMLADALARDYPGRFLLLTGCFSNMLSLLEEQGVSSVDGIVMDLGVSSMQLDQGERGFSFRSDGPLDMRMSCEGVSAEVLVNTLPEKELANIIYQYGEEKASRKIAAEIVRERDIAPIQTTGHLADIVRRVVKRVGKADPATRTFQALRVHVNDELGEVQRALANAPHLLRPGGRLIVVTFNSLEDRIVKRFMRPKTPSVSRHQLSAMLEGDANQIRLFEEPGKMPVLPSDEEIDNNPRARSAKLRVGVRTQHAIERVEESVE
ncbi:MAG: 16S rRNA (cytosine(1402)-N(4))-methyltransferase RsmH [Rickettsiales bacterium]|nr:16S rRNA (cytosine(1402)-N(4))-methyltransferase RsmH [Rickettsiales bacterium]